MTHTQARRLALKAYVSRTPLTQVARQFHVPVVFLREALWSALTKH